MATRSRYLLKIHPGVNAEDLPDLPPDLQSDFTEVFQPILKTDPYGCDGFDNHILKGRLRGYRVLDIEWESNPNAYKLVYRIYDKPSPKRVAILSFDEHDAAYEKAIIRAGRNR